MKKKLVHLFIIIIILIFNSCTNNNKKSIITFKRDTTLMQTVNPKLNKKKVIEDYASDTSYYTWKPLRIDNTNLLCEITFFNEYVIYWFHGQCVYYYFTFNTDEGINLLWSYKTDCISNMNFLEKSHGIKKYPKRGDLFATYNLVNDTIIKVKYYFPEWIKKINEIEKDSIYPTFLYLNKAMLKH